MSKIKNRNVLITGGAAGIGKLMGERFLKEGALNLVIWDVNEENLYRATSLLSEDYQVFPYIVDVSDTQAIELAADQVLADVGVMDIIVNNAGIVVGKDFEDHTAAEIEKTMLINVHGVMHTTRMFLPGMIRQGRGHIVNIASAAGYLPNPGMSVYVASKWAVLGWSESLRLELERSYHDIHVSTITPGFINTGMFEGVSPPLLMPILEPEEIVDKIIYAVKHNEILVQEPWVVKLGPMLRGILPPKVFDFVAGDIFKVYDSMSKFIGHGHRDPSEK